MSRDTQETDREQPSAAVREHTRAKIDAAPPEQNRHAGLVSDDRLRELLDTIVANYDPAMAADMLEDVQPEQMPATAAETDLYQQILSKQATEVLTRAIQSGNDPVMSYFTGIPDTQSDISGLSAFTHLENQMLTSAPIIYIYGPPGAGKTNLALLLAEIWSKNHESGLLASNIRTWEESDKWIPRWPVLNDWMSEATKRLPEGGITQREDAAPRLFVFDEASTHASGTGKEGHQVRSKFLEMLYKIRKANAGLIIIGHDGKDVDPAIRALATCIERQRGEIKSATLYEDVVDRSGRGKILELSGIPETSYTYDDKEATSWSWNGSSAAEEDKKEEIRKLAADMTKTEVRRLTGALASDDRLDIDQDNLATVIGESYRGEPYDQSFVSKYKRKFENGEL
jgi:hypothetical protein